MIRIGLGYDIHRFSSAGPITLGGVSIPHPRGLEGHSDADVVLHAIMDALLGAAALGDIGRHFPPSDPRYCGASSLDLLSTVVTLIRQSGYSVINIDAVVIAEEPKIAPHAAQMCDAIARRLSIATDAVSIKATTNEGVGPEGRAEAISVHAVALLQRP